MSDPAKSTRHNAYIQFCALTPYEYFNRPTNLAFHDLTSKKVFTNPSPSSTLSFNFRSLLGNGLKFIPRPSKPMLWPTIRDTALPRFSRDLQVKCFMAGKGTDVEFNPRLYIRSKWKPKPGSNPSGLLERIDDFQKCLKSHSKHALTSSNLPPHQRRALEFLRNNRDYLVIRCDKNLGPAIIERDQYIRLILRDHLSDVKTYTRLSKDEASQCDSTVRHHIRAWIESYATVLSKNERKFISHHLKLSEKDPFSVFYGMAKVHKTPLKTRPVVSYSGSTCWALGVWIDSKLQKVAKQQASYFKDSFALNDELRKLSLQPNDYIFTADAVAMYTNIPTEKALRIISKLLLSRFADEVPAEAVMKALEIVMRNNIFTFGDMFFKQNTGTAMGAPPAPPWANIFMAISENQFLPYHSNLIFYRRFIDDVIGIWRNDGIKRKWDFFKSKLNNPFFGLEWEISDLGKSCTYMDLNIQITGNRVTTSLYEKPNNLHLFIPAKSCHPPGLLKGMIFGMIYRIQKLCSCKRDQEKRIKEYYRSLLCRGYERETLHPIFNTALQKKQKHQSRDQKSQVFFHVKYHPKNTPPSTIQKLWRQKIAEPPNSVPLSKLRNFMGNQTKISSMVVSHSRSKNLGNLLSYRKLNDDDGPLTSSYMD